MHAHKQLVHPPPPPAPLPTLQAHKQLVRRVFVGAGITASTLASTFVIYKLVSWSISGSSSQAQQQAAAARQVPAAAGVGAGGAGGRPSPGSRGGDGGQGGGGGEADEGSLIVGMFDLWSRASTFVLGG